VGRWTPSTLAELTAARRRLRAVLGDDLPSAPHEGASDALLLAFEELASNALRHGTLPVEAVVTRVGASWLLEVSDAASGIPPAPSADRDPALGGLGLSLVARLADGHGWTLAGGRKVVWACLSVATPTVPSARSSAADTEAVTSTTH
jgi:two-component sensor histidine kinase